MKDDEILRLARADFQRCEDAEKDNRTTAREDIEFARLSKQWPEAVRVQREREGRPCLTINKLAPVVRQVVNDARQNRPSISVKPADSKADPETAEILTGLIRGIEHSSHADVAYDTAIDQAVSGGFGYWRIDLAYANDLTADQNFDGLGADVFEKDICIKRIANQFSVYGDPDSTSADSSDWNIAFVIDRIPVETFKSKYPEAKRDDFTASDWANAGPAWINKDEVTVAEYWRREKVVRRVVGVQIEVGAEPVVMDFEDYKKQQAEIEAVGGSLITEPRPINSYKVTQYVVTGVEVLETNAWLGTYIPIVPVYGDEVNLGGRRYLRSLITDAKDSNRMVNYWRSTATELVALAPKAPFIGKRGAFETDEAKWATANTVSHPYLEYDGPEMPMRQSFAGVPAGALQEALSASDDIKAITGIYDASLGARSNETSGKAIMARQREGDVSTFHFIDNLTRAIRHTGKVIIDLIPKVYSTPRIVRILGEDGKAEVKPINGAQMEADDLHNERAENAQEMARIYDVTVGRYDLIVTAGPSFTSRREEAASQMIEMIRAYPDIAPIIGDLLAKNLDWPGADEIAKRLEKMLPDAVRDDDGGLPPEVQQQMQEMAQAIETMRGELEGKALEARKLDIEEYKAETDRMQAMQPAMPPEAIQQIVIQTLQDLATNGGQLPYGEGAQRPTGMMSEPGLMPA